MFIRFYSAHCGKKICRREIKHLDNPFHFQRINFILFLSKDGRNMANEEGYGWRGVYIPPDFLCFLLR